MRNGAPHANIGDGPGGLVVVEFQLPNDLARHFDDRDVPIIPQCLNGFRRYRGKLACLLDDVHAAILQFKATGRGIGDDAIDKPIKLRRSAKILGIRFKHDIRIRLPRTEDEGARTHRIGRELITKPRHRRWADNGRLRLRQNGHERGIRFLQHNTDDTRRHNSNLIDQIEGCLGEGIHRPCPFQREFYRRGIQRCSIVKHDAVAQFEFKAPSIR